MTQVSPSAQPEPLNQEELQRLWRWERWMIRTYAMAVLVIAVAIGAALVYGEIAGIRYLIVGSVAALVAVSFVLQLKEKCPRCGKRIAFQSGLVLPDNCGRCGTVFKRPPSLDSELDN